MNNTTKEMNMKELEKVTGATIGITNSDSKFLVDMGALASEVGCLDLTIHWGSSSDKVDEAWKKLGVRCVSHPASDNVYYVGGKLASRNDAIKAAAAAAGFTGRLNNYFD